MDLKVSHHLLLCATPSKALCCQSEEGKDSWSRLKSLIKELNLENYKRPEGIVLRSKVDCLRVCQGGPILLIWPDGIWYGNVTPERIESIIYNHIIKGKPLDNWIIKYTPLNKNSDQIKFSTGL
tara:strand:+ start:88 stop:459 length:372 start_codon:yes stop_codon:yes gene_type:complete